MDQLLAHLRKAGRLYRGTLAEDSLVCVPVVGLNVHVIESWNRVFENAFIWLSFREHKHGIEIRREIVPLAFDPSLAEIESSEARGPQRL